MNRTAAKEKFMTLLVDLGNTNISVGVYRDRKPIYFFKTAADKLKSKIEYVELFDQFLTYHKIDKEKIEGAILSSVVPQLTRKIEQAVEELTKKECLVISNKLKSGLQISIDNPNELGSDLICDSVGAINNYKRDCLIIDVGTATKFLVVTKNKVFKGCSIAPGMQISAKSLWDSAAQLSDVEFKAPEKIVGRNSKDSMSSGIVYGHAAMIIQMSKAIEAETKLPLKKIITGGSAGFIKDVLPEDFSYEPQLIFEGLYDIYEKNTGVKVYEKK